MSCIQYKGCVLCLACKFRENCPGRRIGERFCPGGEIDYSIFNIKNTKQRRQIKKLFRVEVEVKDFNRG